MRRVDLLEPIVDLCSRVASVHGYGRSGRRLRKHSPDGNSSTIEFQKSSRSTASEVHFTLNLYVHYRLLETSDEPDDVAHLRQRIGALAPGRPDRWWIIGDGMSATAVAAEVSDWMEKYAIPYLDRFLEISEIIKLWMAGEGPGLTDKQRQMYLDRVRAP